MSEYHTNSRQSSGARRNNNNNNKSRHPRRQRMPRATEVSPKKPSLITRVLNFFGIGKKESTEPKSYSRRQDSDQQDSRNKGTRSNDKTRSRGDRPERRRTSAVIPTRNSRLYVGNLSYEASESELEELFKGFGRVRSVEVIYHSHTYKSKGYAFIEMAELADAQKATEVLHGQPFMGRDLMVSAANERQVTERDSSDNRDNRDNCDSSDSPKEATTCSNEAPASEGTKEVFEESVVYAPDKELSEEVSSEPKA